MKEQISKVFSKYLELMTQSEQVQMRKQFLQFIHVIQFLQRLHFIFPKNGWTIWNYSDFKINVPYVLLSYIFIEASDQINIAIIAINILIFIMSFCKIKIAYYYNNLLWKIFYIPQIIMLQSQNGNIIIQIIGLSTLFLILLFHIFSNRSTNLVQKNTFNRKYTPLSLIIVFFDTICYIKQEFLILTQVLLHCQSLILCLDTILFKPYEIQYNKFAFQLNVLYASLLMICTFSLQTKSEENMFYFSILFGTISYAISQLIYQRYQDELTYDQFSILSRCQEFYFSNDITSTIKILLHKQKCEENHNKKDQKLEIIICIINGYIINNKKLKIDFELLELALIDLQEKQKAPLTALCRLKKYYSFSEFHSIYFKLSFPFIHNKLWESVTRIQEQVNQKMRKGEIRNEKELTTGILFRAVKIRDKGVLILLQGIEAKFIYWKQLNNSLNNFKQLLQITIQMSETIQKCKNSLQQLFECEDLDYISEQNTVLEKIILIIFYAIILNNREKSLKIQQNLNEIIKQTNFEQNNQVTNYHILNNKVCLLYTSIVKNQGAIIKSNASQIAKFWGYENEMDFREINHINQLMPEFLAQVHDQYLNKFITLGHSILFGKNRTVFLKGKNNFYIFANITIDNFFISYDDYIITAMFSKTKESSMLLMFDQSGRILGQNRKMFDLFVSIDKFVTQEIIATGFIFQFIPSIFNIINFYQNNQDYDEQIILKISNPIISQIKPISPLIKDKTNIFSNQLAGLFSTTESPQMHFSQKNQQQHENLNNLEYISKEKPECLLFDKQYQEKMSYYCNEDIISFNFSINCNLEYIVLGYYQAFPVFILEITDANFIITKEVNQISNIDINSQSINSINLKSPNSSEVALSSIQNESFEKLKVEDDKLQQNNEFSLMKGKYDQSFYDQLQESSRQMLGPFSQRATFNLVKLKTMTDDMNVIEDEFKSIKIQQIMVDQVEKQLFSHHQGRISINTLSKNLIDIKNTSTLSNEKNKGDHQYILLQQIANKKQYPNNLLILFYIMVFILLTIIFFAILEIIIVYQQKDEGQQKLNELQAPYLYNRYYCEITTYDLFIRLTFINKIAYSKNLIETMFDKLNQFDYLSNLQDQAILISSNILNNQNFNDDFSISNITIYIIDQENYVINSFVFQNLLNKIYMSILLNNYQDYSLIQQLNYYQFKEMIYELINFQDSYQELEQLMQIIIAQFYDNLNTKDELIMNLFIIQTLIQFLFFIFEVFIFVELQKIYKKILNVNCRIYENDVINQIQKLAMIRDIVIDKYSIKWKQSNYVNMMFQTNYDLTQVTTIQNKQTKAVLLTSRISQYTITIYQHLIFLFILIIIIMGSNIGGFLLNVNQQQQLKPSYELSAEFLHFSLQMDIIITESVRIKIQNLIFLQNNLTSQLNEQQLQSIYLYFQNDRYQNLSNFKQLFMIFQQNQINILQNLMDDQESTTNNEGMLYQLFFSDICNLICPNSTDYQDNCTLLYNKGIIGIYTQLIQFIGSGYSYELENEKLDQEQQNLINFINQVDFFTILGRHYTNAKIAFDQFYSYLKSQTNDLIIMSFNHLLIYYICALVFTLIVVIIIQVYFLRIQYKKITLIKQSLIIIPLELIDQQIISILRQL